MGVGAVMVGNDEHGMDRKAHLRDKSGRTWRQASLVLVGRGGRGRSRRSRRETWGVRRGGG